MSKNLRHTAKQAMSGDLVTISGADPIGLAHERMRACNIRHLPVRGDDGKIVGIISDRDVQRAMRSKVRDDKGMKIETTAFDASSMVSDYMSWPVRSFDAGTDLRTVAEQMVEEKVSSILVTEHGKTAGIITTEDMLKVLLRLLEHEESEPTLRGLLSRELWVTG